MTRKAAITLLVVCTVLLLAAQVQRVLAVADSIQTTARAGK